MRLVLIYRDSIKGDCEILNLFTSACTAVGYDLLAINVNDYNFLDLPDLTENDILYRIGGKADGRVVEKKLINSRCKHFYTDWTAALSGRAAYHSLTAHTDAPAIPTIPTLPQSRIQAAAFADKLGGFPLIAKVLGKSKGIGVIKIDSQEGLVSTCDYLRGTDSSVLLRKFIDHEYYGRFIVLGDKVVASNRTWVLEGDFRSNTTDNIESNREPFTFPKEIESIAIEAAHTEGLQFGGVDLLFDAEGTAYVAEVNFPTQFNFAQRITGIDIAALMLEFAAAR